ASARYREGTALVRPVLPDPMAAKLKEVGVEHEFITVPGAGHGLTGAMRRTGAGHTNAGLRRLRIPASTKCRCCTREAARHKSTVKGRCRGRGWLPLLWIRPERRPRCACRLCTGRLWPLPL